MSGEPVRHPRCLSDRLLTAAISAALLFGAAGCAGSGAATTDDAADLPLREDADRLMRAGDYESATRIYARRLEGDDSPVLREKWRTARRLAGQRRAEAAIEAAALGDEATARHHLAAAQEFAAGTPAVRRAEQQLDATLGSARAGRELREEGRALLRASPEDAQDVLAEARRHDPDNRETVVLLREATLRAEAERAAKRAAEAWIAGDLERTARELRQAQFGGQPVSAAVALRARMERDLLGVASTGDELDVRTAYGTAVDCGLSRNVARQLREALITRLRGRSAKLFAAGRPATAAILETECLRLGASMATPGLDAVRGRAQITLVVLPFEDRTGGGVDGLRLARLLARRLAADVGPETSAARGLALRVVDAGADGTRVLAAHPRALRVEGTALSQRVARSPDASTTRRVRYVESTREEANPESEAALRTLRDAQSRLERARTDVADADRVLRELRAAPIVRGPIVGRRGRARVRYETSLARARAEVERRQQIVVKIEAEELAARQAVVTTPPRREVPVHAEHRLSVTKFRKSSQVTVRLRLLNGDRALLDASVTGSALHDETVAPAFGKGGVAADPDDAPSDAEMADEAQAHFARIASGQVRAASEAATAHFLDDARAAERAGRREEAAESYALYLLATPEVASPRRADAARALREIARVHVSLRTDPGGH